MILCKAKVIGTIWKGLTQSKSAVVISKEMLKVDNTIESISSIIILLEVEMIETVDFQEEEEAMDGIKISKEVVLEIADSSTKEEVGMAWTECKEEADLEVSVAENNTTSQRISWID